MAERKMTVLVDPSLQFERQLHYRERHAGWEVFKGIYWAIYAFVLGLLLVGGVANVPQTISVAAFFGYALMLFALFLVIYGLVVALHLSLMKRHA